MWTKVVCCKKKDLKGDTYPQRAHKHSNMCVSICTAVMLTLCTNKL